MTLQVGMYHFHCASPRTLAAFWSRTLDIPVDEGASDELVMLDFAHEHGHVTWIFQRTDDQAPGHQSRIVLDLSGEDWREQADRVEAAGATRLGEYSADTARWIEMTDPEGNLFRIFEPR